MEDHLQNTTRLDTEWNALCQYQADGVTYDAAMENIRKNRSSSLPCKFLNIFFDYDCQISARVLSQELPTSLSEVLENFHLRLIIIFLDIITSH